MKASKPRWKYLTAEDCVGLTFEEQKAYDELLRANVRAGDGILKRQTLENRQKRECAITQEPPGIYAIDHESLKAREWVDAKCRAKLTAYERAMLAAYEECGSYRRMSVKAGISVGKAHKIVSGAIRKIRHQHRLYDGWWIVRAFDCIPRHLPEGYL